MRPPFSSLTATSKINNFLLALRRYIPPATSLRAGVIYGFLAISISPVFAASAPKAEDYLIGPASLPPLPTGGEPHELQLNPASLSLTTPADMPVTEFGYDIDALHRRVVGIQIFDSQTYATVNRMQLAGEMGSPLRARCYQPIKIHPGNEPQRTIDGFLGKVPDGCAGELFLIVPANGRDRFLVRVIELGGVSKDPEKLRAWLLAAAAKLDFKKLQKIPAVE